AVQLELSYSQRDILEAYLNYAPYGRNIESIGADKKTGIGDYSFEDFDNAVRKGVAKNGSTLYPAMPYPSFALVKEDDMRAMYAYFMHGVQPVEQA
ncbi:hypothetical protein RF070_12520, partial [Serratia marcescens]|nr:hypothetical protein [Serratia marcescens]